MPRRGKNSEKWQLYWQPARSNGHNQHFTDTLNLNPNTGRYETLWSGPALVLGHNKWFAYFETSSGEEIVYNRVRVLGSTGLSSYSARRPFTLPWGPFLFSCLGLEAHQLTREEVDRVSRYGQGDVNDFLTRLWSLSAELLEPPVLRNTSSSGSGLYTWPPVSSSVEQSPIPSLRRSS